MNRQCNFTQLTMFSITLLLFGMYPLQAQTLPITMEITKLHCHNADEDSFFSDGDEPYLLVAAMLADGTTIHLGDISHSGAIVNGPSKTHGNMQLRSGLRSGRKVDIPASIGRFDLSITPVDTNGIAGFGNGQNLATVGIVVVLMEEDSTPTSAADRGQRALVSGLQSQLDAAIRSLTTPDPQAIRKSLKKKIKRAMKGEARRSLMGMLSGVDPDDNIGADFALFSYADISSAGNAGLTIQMDFKKKGVHYSLEGQVQVRR